MAVAGAVLSPTRKRENFLCRSFKKNNTVRKLSLPPEFNNVGEPELVTRAFQLLANCSRIGRSGGEGREKRATNDLQAINASTVQEQSFDLSRSCVFIARGILSLLARKFTLVESLLCGAFRERKQRFFGWNLGVERIGNEPRRNYGSVVN